MAMQCKCKWCGLTFEGWKGYDNWSGRAYEYHEYCSKKCWDADGRKMQRSD